MSEENIENLTATIGMRVPPGFKQWAKEEAEKRGETLTDFLWSLIDAGVKQMFPELFT
jgi:hypothetical protein